MKARARFHELGPYAIRVIVVTSLLLLTFLIVFIVASSSRGTYEMRAVFDDVRGLIPGGEVRAGAIPIGTVTSVELNENDQPEVTFEVDDDFPLHEGAIADIRLGSNVGAVNRAIELTQGDLNAPELEAGSTLTGDSTDQPVNFDAAVEVLDPSTRADLKRVVAGLDAAVKGTADDFDRTLRYSSAATNEAANLIAQVGADGDALRTLVGETERIVSALAASPGDLGAAADQTALLLATTGGRAAELAEAVRLLGPALADGRTTLDRLAAATPNLRELVTELRPVVDELGPLARLLPPATDAAAPFLEQTRRLVEGGPADLAQSAPIIDAAVPVAPQLNETVRTILPFAQVLRAYAPESIAAFQNFGAHTGGYDRVGHVWNVRAGLAQTGFPAATAAAGTIGPTDCGPGSLEMPLIRAPGTLECDPWVNYRDSFIFPKDEER